jgi:hypothetical protein
VADGLGHFALINGRRCHPLTVLDDHSRFFLSFAELKIFGRAVLSTSPPAGSAIQRLGMASLNRNVKGY